MRLIPSLLMTATPSALWIVITTRLLHAVRVFHHTVGDGGTTGNGVLIR